MDQEYEAKNKVALMRYVIFGNGRVGGNLAAYLRYLDHTTDCVSHAMADNDISGCRERIAGADIVIAAIPDGKLALWRQTWEGALGGRLAVHLSGASAVPGMYGFHPLFSFPKSIVDLKTLETIPFACSAGAPPFAEVFPGAPNPHFTLRDEDRAKYHALAALSGNLSAFLWNQSAKPLSDLSGLPAEQIMGGYLQSLVDRFTESPTDSLTGPVARRDAGTVAANLAALDGEMQLKRLYETFLETAWPDYPE